MLTYIPICHFQGTATRSAVRATPRNSVSTPVVRKALPKSKSTTAFHLLRVKGEFMRIHPISCFKFFKASEANTQTPGASKQSRSDKKIKNPNEIPSFINHDTKEKQNNKVKDKFLTPPNQIRDVDNSSLESMFSEITASTFHEDIEEYKRRNSSAGFWFPVIPDDTRAVSESRPQLFLGSKYASLADASRSQQARFQRKLLESKRYMISPEDRILEKFINNILATLATMFPQFAHELLAMRDAFFIDLINAKVPKKDFKESKDWNSLKCPINQGVGLKKHPNLLESMSNIIERNMNHAEQNKFLLKEITNLCVEHIKAPKAEIEGLISATITQRYEEILRRELDIHKQKYSIAKIKQLRNSFKESEMIVKWEKRENHEERSQTIWIQPSFQIFNTDTSNQASLVVFTNSDENNYHISSKLKNNC
ncbi:hypothetical protein EV44_g5460 [Erysiphe necator]|uniref:Uncharacterized protein n=1 Tax=Uncinula necator TaxID=52586 RepID=A0A0B1NWY7_UNCNE|nr:hypothetical protein EV44_g5460 [Erysiphe necator]